MPRSRAANAEVWLASIDTHVGGRIAARRRSAGMSVEDLAARAGVPPARLHAYEAGEQRLTADHLLALCDALGVGPSYFFEGFASGDDRHPLEWDADA